jgi:hypothetical protein
MEKRVIYGPKFEVTLDLIKKSFHEEYDWLDVKIEEGTYERTGENSVDNQEL